MKHLLLFLLVSGCGAKRLRTLPPSTTSAGIPSKPAPSRMLLQGFKSKGEWRSSYVYAPRNTSVKRPVILVLHGGKMNHGLKMLKHFNGVLNNNAIFVFANGLNNDPNLPGWTGYGRLVNPNRDVTFLTDLVKKVQEEYNGDPERTFVTGFSNGGYMTWHLACLATDTFAGFAPVGKPIPRDLVAHCDPGPTNLLYAQGNADQNFLGDEEHSHSAEETRKIWAELAHCSAPEQSESDKRTSFEYTSCDGRFTAHEYHDWPHRWPYGLTDELLKRWKIKPLANSPE